MARPSDYSEDVAADICQRLAGGESLTKICGPDDMPHVSTVYRWIGKHETFRDIYARAREDQADTLADEILKIADEDPATVFLEKTGQLAIDGAAIAHQRLRIDARKWVAAKLKPKKYGEKSEVNVEHSGAIEHRGLPEISSRITDLLSGRAAGDSPPLLSH